jgi:hypothetical protein
MSDIQKFGHKSGLSFRQRRWLLIVIFALLIDLTVLGLFLWLGFTWVIPTVAPWLEAVAPL